MKITNAQIKKIHALKNVLNIDDELYREMLQQFNAGSSKDLNSRTAEIFISSLEVKAVQLGVWKNPSLKFEDLRGREEKIASPAQLRMIYAMWKEISYYDTDEFITKSLRTFVRGRFKIDDIKFLTKKKAVKVIYAIKSLKKNLERHAAEDAADGT